MEAGADFLAAENTALNAGEAFLGDDGILAAEGGASAWTAGGS